ncbi:hypothetical protein OPQ81_001554 [Rhizoctonia solani]|nr:hypothetical protein OPQ81_001554 [Rhizoctonia solani]
MNPTPTTDEAGPHSMRVASHGKISVLVDFALKFLKENPTRPLVLHTLPYKSGTGAEENKRLEPDAKRRKIEPSTTNVARLISVVEIIKREFKEGPLHQYNEIGCLDPPSSREGGPGVGVPSEPGAERWAALQRIVEGKNHLPIQRTPYMKITLSQTELPESEASNTTYQPPVTKKVCRGTRKRSKRRDKNTTTPAAAKSTDLTDNDAEKDAMDIVPT